MSDRIIVLATKNEGKKKEIVRLLQGRDIRILTLSDFGPTPDPVEDADIFEDNAYLKAYHYARILGWPALADDSGLKVDALNGAPGVRSARWAGPDADDRDRCRKLLAEMEGRSDRGASFVCALVLAAPHGPGLTWVGSVEGEITREPRGENGFGYDPVFYYPPAGKTFAQMAPDEKNLVSHRGRVLAEFKAELDKVLVWLRQREAEVRPPSPHEG